MLVPCTESKFWLQCIGEIRLQSGLDVLCGVDSCVELMLSSIHVRYVALWVCVRQEYRVFQKTWVWSYGGIDDDSRIVDMSMGDWFESLLLEFRSLNQVVMYSGTKVLLWYVSCLRECRDR